MSSGLESLQILDLQRLASLQKVREQPSWYMSHYTMLSKYGNCTTRLLKIKNKLKIGCFYK